MKILYLAYTLEALANSADQDQKPFIAASVQGEYCLPLIRQVLDESTGRKINI